MSLLNKHDAPNTILNQEKVLNNATGIQNKQCIDIY